MLVKGAAGGVRTFGSMSWAISNCYQRSVDHEDRDHIRLMTSTLILDACFPKRYGKGHVFLMVWLSSMNSHMELWICDMAGLLHGTFVSWLYLPRIWPAVTDMQYYYHARYPTDDWHLAYMFSLVYFSVEVCLEGVFPHSVSTRRDSCVRVYAPSRWLPTFTKKIEQGGPALHLNQARGIWTDEWVCLHYWVVIWVAG